MSTPSLPAGSSEALAAGGGHPAGGACRRACREGLPGPVRALLRSCRNVALASWRRIAQHRNYVFEYSGAAVAAEPRSSLALDIQRYDGVEAVPPATRMELEAAFGVEALAADRWEMQHGAVLWLARLNGALCGASMTRRGGHFRRWFVPLRPDDIVIFRNRTWPQFRGRGICPALMRAIIAREIGSGGGRAYVDCRVYNTASIRSIEKAGFRRIATLPPLSREQALGADMHPQPGEKHD